MNDLLARVFSRRDVVPDDVERGPAAFAMEEGTSSEAGDELSGFFQEVDTLKKEMARVRDLLTKLQDAHEESKTARHTPALQELRDRINEDIGEVTKTSRLIKQGLEDLNKSNAASREIKGCEKGSSTDRTRIQLTNSLTESLKDLMHDFGTLRTRIVGEYREIIGRSYYTVTGQRADETTIDRMVESGESETFIQRAIQEQGKGEVIDSLRDIQEQHEAVKDIERNLQELNQIFVDLSVLVEAQGALVNDIQTNVERADSYTKRAAVHLQVAKTHQRKNRLWMCAGVSVMLIAAGVVAAIIATAK
ncbi:protein MpSYP12B [Marchantia polymorpha subsp. ruderalis]|nr:hypothetical protein MARPO_0101s0013 [Marchantia polymorpha]BAS01259.1 syntaxin of plant 12B [Marchantia polymorpha]BBN09553.1 hypothetical protein Mp_4g20670 [Marchantia polymorpha subsp. ruderalis]|eukprot:PTQ32210.1 hypothetical protein MARPO_0101s0013 [Marchantia polymorpha]